MSDLNSILQEVQTLSGVAASVAPGHADQINRVGGYVQLGAATAPVAAQLFSDLFHLVGNLFHHAASLPHPAPAQAQVQPGQSTNLGSPANAGPLVVK